MKDILINLKLFQNKQLRSLASIGIALLMLFSLTGTVVAKEAFDNYESPEEIIAKQYAEKYSVSVDEAILRLNLQNSSPDLEPIIAKNEPDTFGGLWIQHEPEFKVIVAFTNDCEKKLANYSGYISKELAPYIQTKEVEKSLADLIDDLEQLVSSFRTKGIHTDSWVDVMTNCVVVYIDKDSKSIYDHAIESGKLILPNKVRIQEVQELTQPATDIYGGLTLKELGGADYVTNGFPIIHSSTGTPGIVTTTHGAYPYDLYYESNNLPYQNHAYGGKYDFQWHTAPTLTITPTIQIDRYGGTRGIWGQLTRDQQRVNACYGKYGRVSYYTHGVLISKTCIPDNVPVALASWMLVENTYGADPFVAEGDSGGPWFVNTNALGITHGVGTDGQGNQYGVYMAIDLINIFGLTVMTN